MGNIKFSIIIPLYNKVNVIADTIGSVINQNYTDFEVLVVDDGSTDGSAEVVKKISDNRIQLLQIPNGGVSHARNYGAQHARNPWLIFLDGDDLMKDGALEVFIHLMSKFPHEMVYSGNYIDDDQKKYGPFNGKKECIYENPLKAMWNKRFNLRPGATVCHITAFHQAGGFNESICYYEDWEFYVRLGILYRVAATPSIVMEYVVDNNEGRRKLQPIEKEFAYHIGTWNLSNCWLKSMIYNIVYNAYRRRKKTGDNDGAQYYRSLISSKFGKYYYCLHFFTRIRKRFQRYGI